MSDLNFFVKSRKYLRKAVTEIHNTKDTFSTLTVTVKTTKRLILEEYLKDLNDLDSKIRSLKWVDKEDESELETELKSSKEYSLKIRECLVLLEVLPTAIVSSRDPARSLLKSPMAPLPKYDSKEGEDLHKFFLQFEETLNKFSYPDYDKLLLLKQQVSGRASILLNSLENDKQSYSDAKQLLVDALASPVLRKFNVIKQLSEMKLSNNSDPFEYISKIKYITESVKNLNIDVDTILQYFFWCGLNEDFRMQLVQITNHTRPSLIEINEHFFEACERYRPLHKSVKDCKKRENEPQNFDIDGYTTGLAVKVDYERNKSKTFRPCSICSKLDGREASHAIQKCPKFETASDKVSQLFSLQGCTKCSNLNHATKDCKFRFNSRCSKCKQWHMNYLCIESASNNPRVIKNNQSDPISESKPSIQSTSKETVSGLTVSEALQSDIDGESILPTFTCDLNGITLRGLKDGGCQSNFISDRLATQHNLKVLKDNISLTVRGINVPKKYVTKLVEAKLKFGNDERVVTALCLPSINIVLKLPNLQKVVRGFVNRGYDLADKKLINVGDKIDDIDLILGAKSGYCISESEITFGKGGCSIYSQTSQGIMLKGDIDRLLDDLEFLPVLANSAPDCSSNSTGYTSQIDSLGYLGFGGDSVSCLTSNLECLDILTSDDSFSVFDSQSKLVESDLQKAAEQILDSQCSYYTNHDENVYDDQTCELNSQLSKFVLDNTVQDEDGRLKMPLLWNAKVSHLLGKNRKLAAMILRSNLKNLSKNAEKIKLIDLTFKEQEAAGIIERVENLDDFLKLHPEHSFLPHMAVLKPDRETTKCRIVFLSNLCERDANKAVSISHNQAIHAGPSLNQKISSSLLHLRFDPKMLVFDIKKAFNNISLSEIDQNRLLFLWFRNVEKNDFSIVAYRNVRLSFGLRCSPALLMLGLFKMLVLDAENDLDDLRNLKSLIYQLCYMDNCAITAIDSDNLRWAFGKLPSIFDPYRCGLQQFVSNDENLQSTMDATLEVPTPTNVKLLGMVWDRLEDTLSTRPICLNVDASTKRQVLMTIASQFDIYNYNGPVLNRSRLFLHRLQCQKDLGWDETLSSGQIREWKNITRQVNSTPNIAVKRSVGRRDGRYKLIGFCDSSKLMYGAVMYIKDVDTGEVSFLLSKNRIINKQLETKSIPSLEMQAISLATECILDLFSQLSGSSCMKPIEIADMEIYSDSLVSLTWLNSYTTKMDKMQKRSVFVLNRINHINKLCEKHPIKFSFVSGSENPADCVTRCISYKQLLKTNYFAGPKFLHDISSPELSREDYFSLVIPNPAANNIDVDEVHGLQSNVQVVDTSLNHLVPIDEFSSFSRIISVHKKVLTFVNILKGNLKKKYPDRFGHFQVNDEDFNYFAESSKQIILREQTLKYPDILEYFHSGSRKIKDIPNLVAQLNVYMDQEGLLRVKSKCERLKGIKRFKRFSFPLLLSKNSRLTDLIVLGMHKKFSHVGCYSLLSELRKKFWIPHFFTVVKRVLKSCVVCKRFNERTLKLNQSSYRQCRLDPCNVPFSNVYMDYMGPFFVKSNGVQVKTWILCVTCMWSRAINLKVCVNQAVPEFLRAFQLHCFEFGIPQLCITDLGTQLTAGANVMMDFLKDHETKGYFDENGVQPITFEHFFKGHSELGSMVEICVKLTKRLISKAIGKNVLSFRDFEFLICKTVHLVNRRPVAFKDGLRDSTGNSVPGPITPECLIRGYDLISVNVIPDLQAHPDVDWSPAVNPQSHVKSGYEKLQRVRSKLIEVYNEEFLSNLVSQAVNIKDRYRPVLHKHIAQGDIVLIKEPFAKPSNYPMGVVKKVIRNDNNEVTGAVVMKGKTRELLKRHSSTLIPLLMLNKESSTCFPNQISDVSDDVTDPRSDSDVVGINKPRRQAAIDSEKRTKNVLQDEGD